MWRAYRPHPEPGEEDRRQDAGCKATLAATQSLEDFVVRDDFDRFRIKAQLSYYQQLEKLDELGVGLVLQGWIPGEFKGFGEWASVEEMPQTIIEHAYPLYPLKPDPREKKHTAAGRAQFISECFPEAARMPIRWAGPGMTPILCTRRGASFAGRRATAQASMCGVSAPNRTGLLRTWI